jgi:hypothetical protein
MVLCLALVKESLWSRDLSSCVLSLMPTSWRIWASCSRQLTTIFLLTRSPHRLRKLWGSVCPRTAASRRGVCRTLQLANAVLTSSYAGRLLVSALNLSVVPGTGPTFVRPI